MKARGILGMLLIVSVLFTTIASPSSVATPSTAAGDMPAEWVMIEVDARTDSPVVRLYVDGPGAILGVLMPFRSNGNAVLPQQIVRASGEFVRVGAGDTAFDTPFVNMRGDGFTSWPLSGDLFRVVFLVGGEYDEWGFTVDAPAPWRELARGRALALEPRHFSPVGADASVLLAGAYVASGTYSIDIEHELVGVAENAELVNSIVDGWAQGSTDRMSVTGPNGTRECPCTFRNWRSPTPDVNGPGTYEFAWRSAGTRALFGPVVLVADIPLFE